MTTKPDSLEETVYRPCSLVDPLRVISAGVYSPEAQIFKGSVELAKLRQLGLVTEVKHPRRRNAKKLEVTPLGITLLLVAENGGMTAERVKATENPADTAAHIRKLSQLKLVQNNASVVVLA